jgi:hypothetical protein
VTDFRQHATLSAAENGLSILMFMSDTQIYFDPVFGSLWESCTNGFLRHAEVCRVISDKPFHRVSQSRSPTVEMNSGRLEHLEAATASCLASAILHHTEGRESTHSLTTVLLAV